ncbi:MAG TPA: hypothetical protein VNB59_03405 [Solirubrobacterales bacterium]|jgi:hypothetical protein|nr:hypothetical protein [Solirubrobacterales bacterium]
MGDQGLAAWKLPLIVSAIAVSIVGGFYLGGPGLGMAVGALAASSIVVMAVRHPPLGPIEPPPASDLRDHLLVVVEEPLEDGEAIEEIAAASHGDAEVLVLAPAHNRFLDRWASDTGPGRDRAQLNLVLSLASLAGAGVAARARIGDEDVVQSVTDELREYPATEVFLVSGEAERSRPALAAAELRARLRAPFRHLPCRGEGAAAAFAHSGDKA